MELNSSILKDIEKKCTFNGEGEEVIIKSFFNTYHFSNKDLLFHKEIIELLLEKIYAIRKATSFFNFFFDEDGKKWTNNKEDIDLILALGLATKLLYYVTEEQNWKVFPGGVPLVVIVALDTVNIDNRKRGRSVINQLFHIAAQNLSTENRDYNFLLEQSIISDKPIMMTGDGVKDIIMKSMYRQKNEGDRQK